MDVLQSACTSAILFLLVLVMLYLKKVLFFEDMPDKVKRNVKIGLCVILLVFAVEPIIKLFYSNATGWLLVVGLVMAYILIAYSSYFSRVKRKWLSFFIGIPLAIFALSIYNIVNVLLILIKMYYVNNVLSLIFLPAFLMVIEGILCIFRKIRGSLVWRIEKYSEGKQLSGKEEGFVCISALVLGISIFLATFYYSNDDRTRSIIMSLGFVLAIVILYTVYSANGRQYYEKQNYKLQRTLITTMADLVEDRDESTGGHIRRTARYVEVIARELQREKKFTDVLTDKYIEDMIIAAPLHDIGKIHVPDNILTKKDKLLPEEYETMKTHAMAGYNIIVQVEKKSCEIEYIKVAKQMAKSHHEWINGNGYPEGLKGDEIPLCAKILAVADVFDALVSKRCYKKPMPLEQAYRIIHEETGSHFDENVVAAFFAAQEAIESVLREEGVY